MQDWALLLIICIIIGFVAMCYHKDWTKKLKNESETYSYLEKHKYIKKILDSLPEDEKNFGDDMEFKMWQDKIRNATKEYIYQSIEDEKTNYLYFMLKEYEMWRTQKLR